MNCIKVPQRRCTCRTESILLFYIHSNYACPFQNREFLKSNLYRVQVQVVIFFKKTAQTWAVSERWSYPKLSSMLKKMDPNPHTH